MAETNKNKMFAGTIVDKSELVGLDDDKSALNLTIEVDLLNELIDDTETVMQRVVLFNKMAEKADVELEEGNAVIITDGSRNPRTYTTAKKTTVSTVDIVARRFKKVAKKKLADLLPKLTSKMFTLEDLEFTAEDALLAEGSEETLDEA